MMHHGIALVNACPDNSALHMNRYAVRHDPRQVIRRLLEQRGFNSPRALAIAAGMPQPTLSRYLAGTSSTMSMEHFCALAHTLGVTVSQLLGETPLHDDPRVNTVLRVMERMNDAGRDAVAATAKALADTFPPEAAEQH